MQIAHSKYKLNWEKSCNWGSSGQYKKLESFTDKYFGLKLVYFLGAVWGRLIYEKFQKQGVNRGFRSCFLGLASG